MLALIPHQESIAIDALAAKVAQSSPLVFQALGLKDNDGSTLGVVNGLRRKFELLTGCDEDGAGSCIPEPRSIFADALP